MGRGKYIPEKTYRGIYKHIPGVQCKLKGKKTLGKHTGDIHTCMKGMQCCIHHKFQGIYTRTIRVYTPVIQGYIHQEYKGIYIRNIKLFTPGYKGIYTKCNTRAFTYTRNIRLYSKRIYKGLYVHQ